MIKTTLCGSELPILQSQLLNKEAGIVHFSTLRGKAGLINDSYGETNLCDYSGDSLEHVNSCKARFAQVLDLPVERLWFPKQVHGSDIMVVGSHIPSGQICDAVITKEKNLLIGVSTADCVPILLYDKVHKVIAAIHAGWRGTVAGITSLTVKKFCDVSGGSPKDIIAMIGPSISPQAYEVGTEVSSIFEEKDLSNCVIREFEKPHVDLWKANVTLLERSGVCHENIDCTPVCTFSNVDKLFSARVLGVKSGRISTCIMMTE